VDIGMRREQLAPILVDRIGDKDLKGAWHARASLRFRVE
jgi:hypothetical protein